MRILLLSVMVLAVAYTAHGKKKEGEIRPGGRPCWKMLFCKLGFDNAAGSGLAKICRAYNSKDCYWYKIYKAEGTLCEPRRSAALDALLEKYSSQCHHPENEV